TPIKDLDTVALLARRARQLGFSGAVVMHPTHVPVVNSVFEPSDEEVAYAAGLIEALEAAQRNGVGAITYRGAMVDAAMLPMARQVVQEAGRRGRGVMP